MFAPQNFSNLCWSMARLQHEDPETMSALADAAVLRLNELSAQNMCNMAWALATAGVAHERYFEAMGRAVLGLLPECVVQNLSGGWRTCGCAGRHRAELRCAAARPGCTGAALALRRQLQLQLLGWAGR
jgi:hypothetical protein